MHALGSLVIVKKGPDVSGTVGMRQLGPAVAGPVARRCMVLTFNDPAVLQEGRLDPGLRILFMVGLGCVVGLLFWTGGVAGGPARRRRRARARHRRIPPGVRFHGPGRRLRSSVGRASVGQTWPDPVQG